MSATQSALRPAPASSRVPLSEVSISVMFLIAFEGIVARLAIRKGPALLCTFVVALGLVLGGCSAQAAPTSNPSIERPTATRSAAPTAAGHTFSYSTKDTLGYSVAVNATLEPLAFSSSVVDAAPGRTDIVANINATGTITNTTAGRATNPLFGGAVLALYDLSSPVCKQDLPRSKSVCILELGDISSPQGAVAGQPPLRPGGSEDIGWNPAEISFNVPEAGANQLVTAFNVPMGYAIEVLGQWSVNGTCTVFVTGSGLGAGINYTMADYSSGFSCT